MSTKSAVLELLEQHRGESFSGEELARRIGVSRTAVWKAIGELKKEGHRIEAATNRGYLLREDTDILTVEGILPHLQDKEMAGRIHLFDEVESTNRTAVKMVLEGAGAGTAVIAHTQTSGRGRQGRNFFSPRHRGIYLSVVLRPEGWDAANPARLTTAASVAVCRAVQAVTGQELDIKWVNDLFLNGKKVCGILTEAITDFEAGTIDWVVVGVGINFSTLPEEFPPELQETAGSLQPGSRDGAQRCALAAALLDGLTHLGMMIQEGSFLQEYRRRCMALGKEITVKHPAGDYRAKALDVDDEGRLLVETAEGETRLLSSGEVSVRG